MDHRYPVETVKLNKLDRLVWGEVPTLSNTKIETGADGVTYASPTGLIDTLLLQTGLPFRLA